MDWLTVLLGNYTKFFIMTTQEVITLFPYFLALTWYKNKRKNYFLRLAICIIVAILLCLPLAVLRTHYNVLGVRMFISVMTMSMVVGWLFTCYNESVAELLLCFSGIMAAKNFSGNIFALTLNLFGVDDLVSMSFFGGSNINLDWAIYWLIHAVLLVGIYFFLRKQERLEDEKPKRLAVVLAVFTYLLNVVLATLIRIYQANDFTLAMILKVLLIIIYGAILIFRSNVLSSSRIYRELHITEQLLYQEKKHYEEIKDNIAVVNMKCHDLKHQLSNLQGKLTAQEIEALQEAIRIYDSNIKTGNEILDTVLYQKKLYCDKNGITLKYLTDGRALSFINGTDVYALLTNALDNAIEAVLALPPQKRIIDFTVSANGNAALIEVTNYYDVSANVENDTSKADKTHHGYGLKSMQYITNNYKGTMTVLKEDDLFTLMIVIPNK